MPAMSAAYAVLRPEQIADATPQLTVVQRVGGSIGTAVLAVVLEEASRATGPADASAGVRRRLLVGVRDHRSSPWSRPRSFCGPSGGPGGADRAELRPRAEDHPGVTYDRRRRPPLAKPRSRSSRSRSKGILGAHRRLRSRDGRHSGTIGFAHYRLLGALRREGELTASALAVAADLAPATVTEMLDVLAAAGLVERRRDATTDGSCSSGSPRAVAGSTTPSTQSSSQLAARARGPRPGGPRGSNGRPRPARHLLRLPVASTAARPPRQLRTR